MLIEAIDVQAQPALPVLSENPSLKVPTEASSLAAVISGDRRSIIFREPVLNASNKLISSIESIKEGGHRLSRRGGRSGRGSSRFHSYSSCNKCSERRGRGNSSCHHPLFTPTAINRLVVPTKPV